MRNQKELREEGECCWRKRNIVVVVASSSFPSVVEFGSCYLGDIATSDSLASSEKRLATVNLTNLPQKWKKNR